jgi:hypothetical protein
VRNAYNTPVRKPEGKSHLRDLGLDGRIILKWILNNVEWIHVTRDIDVMGSCEHGNEQSGSIKRCEFVR